MTALHIVGFNLEVWHTFGPGTTRKRKCAVGLKSFSFRAIFGDLDEARVHALRRVFHCSLKQQVAVCTWSLVRLQGAEVVHLRSVCKVQRSLLCACTLANKTNFGAHACVIATKCNGKQTHVAVALAYCNLMTDLPGVLAKFVNCQIGNACRLRSVHFHHWNDERMHVVCRSESLNDNDLAVLGSINY